MHTGAYGEEGFLLHQLLPPDKGQEPKTHKERYKQYLAFSDFRLRVIIPITSSIRSKYLYNQWIAGT
jgi:hypothetical protein